MKISNHWFVLFYGHNATDMTLVYVMRIVQTHYYNHWLVFNTPIRCRMWNVYTGCITELEANHDNIV